MRNLVKSVLCCTVLGCLALNSYGYVANAKVDASVSTNVKITQSDPADITNLLPEKMKSFFKKGQADTDMFTNGVAYGLLETVGLVSKYSSNAFSTAFKNGTLALKNTIPIYDLNDAVSEIMVVFNEGYVIVDAENGELVQYSFDAPNMEYLLKSEKLYEVSHGHFSVVSNEVQDGQFKKLNIQEVKKKANSNTVKKVKEKNKKWGQLNKTDVKNIFDGWYAGNNEGTSRNNTITNEYAWMSNYYGGTNFTATYTNGYSLNVPNINQDNGYSYMSSLGNDCAIVSTLEIMKYKFPTMTDANRQTAYNAIVASSYFSEANGGVGPTNNDQIFKVGAESIGKPVQSTSDDPEQYMNTNNFNFVLSWLQSYGPFYWSMTQAPYGSHTVTVKGVDQFSYSFIKGGYNYTGIDSFMAINDHWQASGTTAYLNIPGLSAYTYATAIIVN
ncbi:hypothetical protein GQF01_27995 [Paenibacillus sp. 5J-6]|uniref:Peptidase C39-like domain-containing protein n=1 Tax=Paenibacillus silvestris TaxID=2606219 RepID=A0A6L8V9C6_9BACL|nr:hypothetical protein [Paenibacillus silvestris]MZQ85949.1 hypothetical protein [Paenibacillus silvestris]